MYRRKKDYTKSLDYQMKAYEKSVLLKNKFEQTKNLHNIGNVYRDMGDIRKAIEYHDKSLKLAEEEGYITLKVNALQALATNYQIDKKWLSAYKFNRQALILAREMGLRFLEGVIYQNIGRFMLV